MSVRKIKITWNISCAVQPQKNPTRIKDETTCTQAMGSTNTKPGMASLMIPKMEGEWILPLFRKQTSYWQWSHGKYQEKWQ